MRRTPIDTLGRIQRGNCKDMLYVLPVLYDSKGVPPFYPRWAGNHSAILEAYLFLFMSKV